MTESINAIIAKQIANWNEEKDRLRGEVQKHTPPKPVITISRTLGSGGTQVAKGISKRMDCQLVGWGIIDKIVESASIRKQVIEEFDEKSKSRFKSWINSLTPTEIFTEQDYRCYLLEVVHSLTQFGSVVMLGRGACFVPRTRPRLDVRIIAPLEFRIKAVAKREKLPIDKAEDMVLQSDKDRSTFIKNTFNKNWNDPLNYDVVINTAMIGYKSAVSLIEGAWMRYLSE